MATNHTKEIRSRESARPERLCGLPHIVSYENTDRLVAFHNPNHLNPNEMLNAILNRHFDFVEQARKTSR